MNMYCHCEVVKIKSESKKPGQHWHCNCDFGMNFLANSYFKYQISHDKTFKMRYNRCLYNNLLERYSWNCLKIRFHRFISFCQFHVTFKKSDMEKFRQVQCLKMIVGTLVVLEMFNIMQIYPYYSREISSTMWTVVNNGQK